MSIWLMNHYASVMYRDKAGRHYWFAKELELRGHDVSVFCASTLLNGESGIDMNGQKWLVQKDGDTPFVFVKASAYKANGLDRVKNMASFYRNLYPATRGYAKQYGKPDVIIASSVHPLTMVAGIRIAKKYKIPCICEVRDLWLEAIFTFGKAGEKSLLGRALVAGEPWIYRKADALIFTKEGDTDYLKEHKWTTAQGGNVDLKKCHYINNGVNLKAYHAQIASEVLDDPDLLDATKFNVIYTGTVRPVNNVSNMLDCAKILKGKPAYDDIGDGCMICADSISTVDISIGNHVIINLDCTIGHDAIIRDFVTLYPSVNVSGNVEAEECVELGTGVQVIQGKKIGAETIVGAGAVVVKDLPEKCTAVGSPAKPI